MEFKIWGKLDEDGRIQSVQSSCSHNLEQGQTGSTVQRSSPGVEKREWTVSRWGEPPGTELLSVDEKNKLVYQLDSKIDEMSCMMVRLGDLTKTLNYQEKLIQEYEDRMRRQEQDIKSLRAENRVLRRHKSSDKVTNTPVSTAVPSSSRISSSASSAIRATCSSADLTSNTDRKRFRTSVIEMRCSVKCTSDSEQTHVKYPSWPTFNTQKSLSTGSICDLQLGVNQFVNIHKQTDMLNDNTTTVDDSENHSVNGSITVSNTDTTRLNDHDSTSGVCKVTRDLVSKENNNTDKDSTGRRKDAVNGLATLSSNSISNKNDTTDTVDGVTLDDADKIDKTHSATAINTINGATIGNADKLDSPMNAKHDKAKRKRDKVAPKPPQVSEDISKSISSKSFVSLTHKPATTTQTTGKAQLEVDREGYLVLGSDITQSDEDVHGTWLSVNQSLRTASRENEQTTTDEGPLDELDGPTCPCSAKVISEVKIRFVADSAKSRSLLQRRTVSHDGYHIIQDDKLLVPPTLPARPKTVAGLCNVSSDEKRPMKSSEKRMDDAFNFVMKTMRTTMEWNKARKTLMKKSTSCTVDMVEKTLTRLVQDLCNTMTSLQDSKAAPLSPRKIARLRKTLKTSHDKDIMTEEFLKKCSDLYIIH